MKVGSEVGPVYTMTCEACIEARALRHGVCAYIRLTCDRELLSHGIVEGGREERERVRERDRGVGGKELGVVEGEAQREGGVSWREAERGWRVVEGGRERVA